MNINELAKEFPNVSKQNNELLVFSSDSVSGLIAKLIETKEKALNPENKILAEIARELSTSVDENHQIRVAIIADSTSDLIEQLGSYEEKLNADFEKSSLIEDARAGFFAGNSVSKSQLGFLFPGQGSQQLNMARRLIERYDWAKEIFFNSIGYLKNSGIENLADKVYKTFDENIESDLLKQWQSEITKTEIAQPAICLASVLWFEYLLRLGLKPEVVGGHSLGELSAFYAGDFLDLKTLMQFVALRAKAMASVKKEGAMCALMCDESRATELLKNIDGYLVIANINSPRQTIISGDISAVDEAVKLASAEKVRAKKLPVSNAFHSEFVKEAADCIRKNADFENITKTSDFEVVSSVDGKIVEKAVDLKNHFSEQVISQVDFISMAKTFFEKCDLMVEVGTGRILTGLIGSISKSETCLPIESKPDIAKDLNIVVASFFVRGGNPNWLLFYENR